MNGWTAISTATGVAAMLFLTGCGGRAANPVKQRSATDKLASCQNIKDQKTFNLARIEDLRGERMENRKRSLARVPGALIGNPLSAIALADTSRAIYVEIDALEKRNAELDKQFADRDCAALMKPKEAVAVVPDRKIDDAEYNYDPLAAQQAEQPGEQAAETPGPASGETETGTETETAANAGAAAESEEPEIAEEGAGEPEPKVGSEVAPETGAAAGGAATPY